VPYASSPTYVPVVYPTPWVYGGPAAVVVLTPKSVGLAAVLAFFFGPLGMLYSTVLGAVVMFAVELVVGVATLGLGLFFTWPLCMIWAVVAANPERVKGLRPMGVRRSVVGAGVARRAC